MQELNDNEKYLHNNIGDGVALIEYVRHERDVRTVQ